MDQSSEEISDLAEGLGCRYLFRNQVNLKRIAKDNHIAFVKGEYGDHFLGELVHYSKHFYIVLNSDKMKISEPGRIRFTIAHELGHFFIDYHRTHLSSGVSLNNSSQRNYKKIDREANHFAAYLLMPPNHFRELSKDYEIGLDSICALSSIFDTSIECTAYHYLHLDLSKSLFVRWDANLKFRNSTCSDSFSKITRLNKFNLPIRINSAYLEDQVKIYSEARSKFIESATLLSSWISTIMPGSKIDKLCLEQTIKLGDFGGFTIITFQ